MAYASQILMLIFSPSNQPRVLFLMPELQALTKPGGNWGQIPINCGAGVRNASSKGPGGFQRAGSDICGGHAVAEGEND